MGFQIAWHDTCSRLGQACIITNLKFRSAQLECFNYNNCSPTAYNRYRSCKTAANEVGSGSPCSFAWVYVPQFLTANITKMACAVLNVPGWMPPKGQLNSYWCYTNGVAPLNDDNHIKKASHVEIVSPPNIAKLNFVFSEFYHIEHILYMIFRDSLNTFLRGQQYGSTWNNGFATGIRLHIHGAYAIYTLSTSTLTRYKLLTVTLNPTQVRGIRCQLTVKS